MTKALRYRWSDDDRYFGPFTYARDHRWKPFALILASGEGANADGDFGRLTTLRLSAFGHTLILALPSWLLKPDRKWVDTSHYGWSNNPKGGYWAYNRREYGLFLNEGHLDIRYGRATHDSSTEQRWGCFLPWTQWRFVAHRLYDQDGNLFATMPKVVRGLGIEGCSKRLDREYEIKQACPKASFSFQDFDGEALTAETKIEEREWAFGEGWFKWLSLFRRNKIRRSLDIWFSGETGRRKGSWKGGTIGHSIDMLPGELHEDAFRRYCAEHAMTFVGPAA